MESLSGVLASARTGKPERMKGAAITGDAALRKSLRFMIYSADHMVIAIEIHPYGTCTGRGL
jgi:hypothetical protein